MDAKVALVSGAREAYGMAPSLGAAGLARSTWYYHTRTRVTYAEKYAHLEAPLKAHRRSTTGVRVPAGHRGAPGDVRAPREPEGGGAAAPALGSAVAARPPAEAERHPAGD